MITVMTVTRGPNDQAMDVLVNKDGMKIKLFPKGRFSPDLITWDVKKFPRSLVQAAHDVYIQRGPAGKKFTFKESTKDMSLEGSFTSTSDPHEDRGILLSIEGKMGNKALSFSLKFGIFEIGAFVGDMCSYWEEKIKW